MFDDDVVEDTEFINLALRSVENAVILNPATARINIEDIDSKLMEGKCACDYSILPIINFLPKFLTNGVCLYISYNMGYYKFRT